MPQTKLYHTWERIKQRCRNPNHPNYQDYGGRGITVCERWLTFENFASDMGEPPTPGHTIERIANGCGYSPENCRWATMEEQGHNKRDNHLVTWQGRTLDITQWAKLLGVSYTALRKRLRRGWSVERAFGQDVQHKTRELTFKGTTLPLNDWALKVGITPATLYTRLQHGWSVERSLTEPQGDNGR